MTGITWRGLPAWPYPENDQRPDQFKAPWHKTLKHLLREIDLAGGREAILGVHVNPGGIRADGTGLKSDARILHAGAEVSFDLPDPAGGWRRATFHTDAFRSYGNRDSFESNVRAIALALEALRLVERYGVAATGQQYAGFAQLTPGPSLAELGRQIVEGEFEGNVKAAAIAMHPDTGRANATVREYQAVIAYRDAQRAAAGA